MGYDFDARMMKKSRDILIFIVLILLSCCIQPWANAANWAQASGKLKQNIVTPYIPAPNQPHWTARYGASSVVMKNSEGVMNACILGGDSYEGNDGSYQALSGDYDKKWYNGYKNDVWCMSGTNWTVKGDISLKSRHGQKIPTISSTLTWKLMTAGILPPPRKIYYDWIICEAYFNQAKYSRRNAVCIDDSSYNVQWSPRRHHASVVFKGYIYVLGGRARELLEFAESRTVGGVIDPRVMDPSNSRIRYTTQRQASALKNDVWRSADGIIWTLVTPGCLGPQASVVSRQGKNYGRASARCTTDLDCYGAESCVQNTCTCQMWSGREQHSAAADDNYIYVSGGYASQLYSDLSACGDFACGDLDASSYRHYFSDVWRSSDGLNWEMLQFPGNHVWPGRGGHQMLIFPDRYDTSTLWIFGGRGGDNFGRGTQIYYNDTWSLPLNITSFTWNVSYAPWLPRSGHTVVYEPPSIFNAQTKRVYVISGQSIGGVVLNDVWIWRPDIDQDGYWVQDFTSEAAYSKGMNITFEFKNDTTPTVNYVYPDGDLRLLQRFFVPSQFKKVNLLSSENRPYMTNEKLAMLHKAGLYTIKDLAGADQKTILKLRGYDFPHVASKDRLQYDDVCDARALAQAILDKCNVDESIALYAGQNQMPWNVIPEFGGPLPTYQKVEWHGRPNYDFLRGSTGDVKTMTANWDGCTYIQAIEGVYGPNIQGIGFVSQVKSIEDPGPIIRELVCRQTPGLRVHHSAAYFENRVYIFGGKSSPNEFHADTWYRDDNIPVARFTTVPRPKTSDHRFDFISETDEPVMFEYRVWFPYKYKELRAWLAVTHKTEVDWLNWRKGGPSNGFYTMYVRAIDPAGNKDNIFKYGKDGNVYRWKYISPTAWDIIFIIIFCIFGLLVLGFLEYHRRIRKAAVERYAMKRLRRKFKALQRDEEEGKLFDWRALYFEAKTEDPFEKKQRKQQKKRLRDKRKERRDRMNKRREQEKERIKKIMANNQKGKTKDTNNALAIAYEGYDKKTKNKRTTQDFENGNLLLEQGSQNSSDNRDRLMIDYGGNENNNRNKSQRRLQWDDDDEILMIENRNEKRYLPFVIPKDAPIYSGSSRRNQPPPMIINHPNRSEMYALPQSPAIENTHQPSHHVDDGFSSLLDNEQNSLFPTLADLNLEETSGTKQRKPNRRYAKYQELQERKNL